MQLRKLHRVEFGREVNDCGMRHVPEIVQRLGTGRPERTERDGQRRTRAAATAEPFGDGKRSADTQPSQ